ncbi:class I SAM-dependent methyltransferase [Cryptosporangium arvum]|uniref:class I SAM-dependent methyltransferase n=1 Tax=Cryptosporangium arvum TaxID=80871 RepID=UPI00055D2EAD|nr:class I SAM-dependent methyltransferase [Cryptosporangium arvum]
MNRIAAIRHRLATEGPPRTIGHDFETVTLPARDCDLVRDLLVAEGARSVVEIGLAFGSSALAVAEALAGGSGSRHVIIDPFQQPAFDNIGRDLLLEAGAAFDLVESPSSVALPQLLGTSVDATFVDGSHRFHEVFVDFYYLRKIVRPGGLVIVDDDWAPSVRTAVRYYERNLGWTALPDAFVGGTLRHLDDDPAAESVPRCRALRLPDSPFEPRFEDFVPFQVGG